MKSEISQPRKLAACPVCEELPHPLEMAITEPDTGSRTVLYQCKCGASIWYFNEEPA
jgi:hypothetical protein